MSEGGAVSAVKKGYDLLVKVEGYVQDLFLLIIRLYWGYQFFLSGKGKLMNLDRTADFFASINIPAPKINALIAGSTECFGGILLLLGLGSRLISIPLAFTMIVAYLTAHRDSLKAILGDNPSDFFTQAPMTFLLVALFVMTSGAGRLSLDELIGSKLFPKQDADSQK
jgi:putative oxidoreductase